MNKSELSNLKIKKSSIVTNIDIFKLLILEILKNINLSKIKNLSLLFLNRIVKTKMKTLPYFFLVDLVNNCNLNCPMCFIKQINYKEDKVDELEYEYFEKIVKELKNNLLYIMFGCLYEPTMNLNVYKNIEICKENGVLPFLTTNLINVDPKKLVESGLIYLQVSLSAGNEELYKKNHGTNDFKKVIENLNKIVYWKKKKNSKYPFIHVKTVLQKNNSNYEEINKIRKILEEIGVDKYSLKKFQSMCEHKNIKDILPDNNLFFQHQTGFDMLTNTKGHRNNAMFYLGPDGKISFNETTYILGKNAKEKLLEGNKIKELLNNSYYRGSFKNFTKNKFAYYIRKK